MGAVSALNFTEYFPNHNLAHSPIDQGEKNERNLINPCLPLGPGQLKNIVHTPLITLKKPPA